MAADSLSYVVTRQNNIRSRTIPWEGAVRVKTISVEANKRIKAIDKVRKSERIEALKQAEDAYISLFLGSEASPSIFDQVSKRPDFVLNLLVLFDDCIRDSEPFLNAILQQAKPYSPFITLIRQVQDAEDFPPLLAANILTKLLSKAVLPTQRLNEAQVLTVKSLYAYLFSLANSPDPGHQDIAVQSYSLVLKNEHTKYIFWQARKGTVVPLVHILRTGAGITRSSTANYSDNGPTSRRNIEGSIEGGVGIQLIYRVLLVFWQLSFERHLVAKGLQDEHDIINLYTQLLRISPKEKITRLLVSTLYNLLVPGPSSIGNADDNSSLLAAALLAHLPAQLSALQSRIKSADQDLIDDLKNLTAKVNEYAATQTTFDAYVAELRSGRLCWSSPVHGNERFWRENARRIIDENQGQLVRLLAGILSTSEPNPNADNGDEQNEQGPAAATLTAKEKKLALAVACNDVARLLRAAPDRRAALEKAGLRVKVMALMQDSDEKVRWESLRALGDFLNYTHDKK